MLDRTTHAENISPFEINTPKIILLVDGKRGSEKNADLGSQKREKLNIVDWEIKGSINYMV